MILMILMWLAIVLATIFMTSSMDDVYIPLTIEGLFLLAAILLFSLRINDDLEFEETANTNQDYKKYNLRGFKKKVKFKKNKNNAILYIALTQKSIVENKLNCITVEKNLIKFVEEISKNAILGVIDKTTFILYKKKASEIQLKEIYDNAIKDLDKKIKDSFCAGCYYGQDKLEIAIDKASTTLYYAQKENKQYLTYNEEIEKTENMLSYVENHPESIPEKFSVFFQPKVNISTLKIESAEALVRWVDKDGKVILYPNQFIPRFERNGFIVNIDLFVFERACELLSQFKKEKRNVDISVNFSRYDLTTDGIIDKINSIASEYNFDRKNLHIEITESLCIEDDELISENISKIKNSNFKIEMDDFGSGCATLLDFSKFEYDYVKIDRVFVQNELNTKKEQVILEKTLETFNSLKVPVIIEGIEEPDTLEKIRNMKKGKNILIQGWVFFQAIKEDDFVKLVLENMPVKTKKESNIKPLK